MKSELRSGDNSASVPWGDLSISQDQYISPQYLPASFQLRDLSKLVKQQALLVLDFWYERQANKKVKTTFEFRGFKGQNSEIDNSNPSTPGKSRKKAQQKSNAAGPSRLRQQDISDSESGSSSDSNSESGSEDDDDEGKQTADKGKQRAGTGKQKADKGKQKADGHFVADDALDGDEEDDDEDTSNKDPGHRSKMLTVPFPPESIIDPEERFQYLSSLSDNQVYQRCLQTVSQLPVIYSLYDRIPFGLI